MLRVVKLQYLGCHTPANKPRNADQTDLRITYASTCIFSRDSMVAKCKCFVDSGCRALRRDQRFSISQALSIAKHSNLESLAHTPNAA
jgi:hypothetical protein